MSAAAEAVALDSANPAASEGAQPAAGGSSTTDAAVRRQERRARLVARAQALRKAYLQVFGIPDYAAYCAHMARRHPDAPLLSQRAFCAQSIDRKYGRNGMRCC